MQGGAGFLMSKINNIGHTYLFDTFEGFLKENKIDDNKYKKAERILASILIYYSKNTEFLTKIK